MPESPLPVTVLPVMVRPVTVPSLMSMTDETVVLGLDVGDGDVGLGAVP